MNKVAVLTGASGRLGPVWQETLEEEGIKVFPVDLPHYDIGRKDLVQKAKLEALRFSADNGDPLGPTILINNAAIDNPPGTNTSFFGNIDRILEVNLKGACYMTEAFIPHMVHRREGIIINIGSILGNVGADWRNYPEGFEKPVAYGLSKAGLIQLSRSITVQYGRYNIRSVTIAFGPYDHGHLIENEEDKKKWQEFKEKFIKNIPMNRFISKESLKQTLLFALRCPELAGQQVLVDGGYCAL